MLVKLDKRHKSFMSCQSKNKWIIGVKKETFANLPIKQNSKITLCYEQPGWR